MQAGDVVLIHTGKITMAKVSEVRLWRFYNIEEGKWGEPFTMCDSCRSEYRVPDGLVMNVVADGARGSCNHCGGERATRT